MIDDKTNQGRRDRVRNDAEQEVCYSSADGDITPSAPSAAVGKVRPLATGIAGGEKSV
jgi:hypothetical protein